MKNLKFILPLLTLPLGVFAQTKKFDKLLISKKTPTVIVNDDIITNFERLKEWDKNQIKSVLIYKPKSDQTDKLAHKFNNLDENGFMTIVTNDKIESKTFRELLENLSIDNNTPLYLDGYKIASLDYKIDPKSIIKIEKLKNDPNNYNLKDFVNITTVNENISSLRLNSTTENIESL